MSDYDAANVFARVIRGELPAHKVFEDDNVVAMMDIFPQSRGHVLVIPKTASRNLLDADPATLGMLLPYVQRVARAVKQAMRADGLRVVQFNEHPAGQTVFHLHVHVIPVYAGTEVEPHEASARADDAALAAQAKAIAAAM